MFLTIHLLTNRKTFLNHLQSTNSIVTHGLGTASALTQYYYCIVSMPLAIIRLVLTNRKALVVYEAFVVFLLQGVVHVI